MAGEYLKRKFFPRLSMIFRETLIDKDIVGQRVETNADDTVVYPRSFCGTVIRYERSRGLLFIDREDGVKGSEGNGGLWGVSVDNDKAFLKILDKPNTTSIASQLGLEEIRESIQKMSDRWKQQKEQERMAMKWWLRPWGAYGEVGYLHGVKVAETEPLEFQEILGEQIKKEPNKLTKKTMLRIPVGLRRLLDKELSVMYKAGFLNEDLTLSPRGMKELVAILLTANKTALAAEATRAIEEAKEDDCDC